MFRLPVDATDTVPDNNATSTAKNGITVTLEVPPLIVNVGSRPYVVALEKCRQDFVIAVLDVEDSQCVTREGHPDKMTLLLLMAGDAVFLSADVTGRVCVWSLSPETTASEGDIARLHVKREETVNFEGSVLCMASHPTQKLVAFLLEGNSLYLRHLADINTNEVSLQVQDCELTVLTQGQHQLIYGTDSGTLHIWHYEDPKHHMIAVRVGSSPVRQVATADDTLVTSAERCTCIRVWDIITGAMLQKVETVSLPKELLVIPGTAFVLVLDERFEVTMYSKATARHLPIRSNEKMLSVTAKTTCCYSVSQTGSIRRMRLWDERKLNGLNKPRKSGSMSSQGSTTSLTCCIL